MPEGAKEGCWRWLVAGAPVGANLCQDPEVVKVRRKVVVEGDYLGVVKVPKMERCWRWLVAGAPGGANLVQYPEVVNVRRKVVVEGDYLGAVKVPKMVVEDLCPDPEVVKVPRMIL